MRVATKLAGGYLVLIVIFGGLLIYYHRIVRSTIEASRGLAIVDSRVMLGASSMLDLLRQFEADAGKYRITGDDGYLRVYRTRRAAVDDSLRAIEGLELQGDRLQAFDALLRDWKRFRDRFASVDPERDAAFLTEAGEDEWGSFLSAMEGLTGRVRDLRSVSQIAVSAELEAMTNEAERAVTAGWTGMAVAIALAGLLAILIVRSIVAPLEKLEAGAAAVAQGDFDVRLEIRGRNELASLARSFDEMTERLEELEEAKRDFLTRISHDLKTPLASIQEVKRLLLDQVPGELNEKQQRLLELGLSNADRLSVMINRLLELARLEAGVELYEFEPVDVAELCVETVERFSPRGTEGGQVAVEGAAEPLWVMGDRGALQRVIENLLENARTHGGDGPIRVTVDRELDGNGAGRSIVRVEDAGAGIPMEDRERIFEAFTQTNEAPAGPGSVGLGLAICREIIDRHGGRIWADEPTDGGAVFAFSLAERAKGPDAPAG